MWTINFIRETQSLVCQIMDIFTLRRIFEISNPDHLIIMYAGSAHTDNVARYLLSSTAPGSYVLRHVAYIKPEFVNSVKKTEITTRKPSKQLMTMYQFAQTQNYSFQKLQHDNVDKSLEVTYDSETLLFNSPDFTKEIIQAMKDRASDTFVSLDG
jgi:hypothetical protein